MSNPANPLTTARVERLRAGQIALMRRFGAEAHQIAFTRQIPAPALLRMEQLRERFLESPEGRRAASTLERGAPLDAEDGLIMLGSALRHDGSLDELAVRLAMAEHRAEFEAAADLFDASRLERGEMPGAFGPGPGGEALLAIRDGHAVGFLVTGDDDCDDVAEAMEMLFVATRWRRRGIGRSLILDLLRRNPSARPAINTSISVAARALLQSVAPHLLAPIPGRNDPCWCLSGKKFKRCHG